MKSRIVFLCIMLTNCVNSSESVIGEFSKLSTFENHEITIDASQLVLNENHPLLIYSENKNCKILGGYLGATVSDVDSLSNDYKLPTKEFPRIHQVKDTIEFWFTPTEIGAFKIKDILLVIKKGDEIFVGDTTFYYSMK